MAFIGERRQGPHQPISEHPRSRVSFIVDHLPRRREPQPVLVGIPPVEVPVYDLSVERFGESHTRFWQNIAEKDRLLKAGDDRHQDIKTALVVGGGGMAGVVTAGMLEEFRDRDMINAFDVVVGVSAGAANTACMLGGKPEAGVKTYTEKLASKEFIRHGLWWPGGMDLSYIDSYLRSDEGIDAARIRAARPDLQIGVVDHEGKTKLVSTKNLDDNQLVNTIITSCAAPYAYNKVMEHEGAAATDGYLAGLPVEQLLNEGYDNILVMVNHPLDYIFEQNDLSRARRLWVRMHMRGYPTPMRTATLTRHEKVAGSLVPLLDRTNANFSILAPAEMHAEMLTTDTAKLTQAGEEGRRVAKQQFESPTFQAA